MKTSLPLTIFFSLLLFLTVLLYLGALALGAPQGSERAGEGEVRVRLLDENGRLTGAVR